ncbi:MAG: type II toxin-antitoxin system VapC family toxin [Kiritimatiellae bacterium]|nr:type II toxin-antitoxin system VapC family toxin [Kiritimatiellia bacterium]
MSRKKVYVETTVISDATALPTNDLALVGRQVATREWWGKAQSKYDIFVSPIVRREAEKGDSEAANRRMNALTGISDLPLTREAGLLAQSLVNRKAVPLRFREDALHIAIAAVEGMDYLVSWNFKHITNAQMIPTIRQVCADAGYKCPEICTPQMLPEEDQNDE